VANLGLGPVRLGLQAAWTVVFFISLFIFVKIIEIKRVFYVKYLVKNFTICLILRKNVQFVYLEATEFMIKLF
jgi:hypothetical protein